MQNLFNYLNRKFGNIEQLNKEVGEMIKTLYDPKVAERARDEGRDAMREAILDFLSSFSDYDEYKDDVSGKLDEIKDFSRLKELIKALAKVSSVKEFLDYL